MTKHEIMPMNETLQWSKQAMLDTMKAVQDGSPIIIAARVHSVPRPGPKQYLSAEEETETITY